MSHSPIRFSFFGSSRFSVLILDELERAGLLPISIITTPDKPQGRHMTMTPTPVKAWAIERNIPVHDPEKLDSAFIEKIAAEGADVFVVASYGKIIPESIINIPPRKTLNIHPSLLPHFRGASPLQSAILNDTKDTGVTLMRIDEKMDHGPIVSQEKVHIIEWPTYDTLEKEMAEKGARLLIRTLPGWIEGSLSEQEQDHAAATFTKKITKEDGLIDLNGDAYSNFLKIQAFHTWPQAYFFHEHGGRKIRVKITEASYRDGHLDITRVIPEGSKEISYQDFQRGYRALS
ncbi:MAG: methionyl-tRNA formyltransferase [Parcubacteria bacterium C7867-002]|nr:MAG: methionyl-tRNA formyltransferase [Parcubacteria bacterium C7867-002]